MSVGEVKATVRQAIQSIDAGRRTIETIAADTADTSGLAGLTVYDSEHPEVKKAMACLREAAREVDLTKRRIDATVEAANDFLRTLG
jgi:hypothetical protein